MICFSCEYTVAPKVYLRSFSFSALASEIIFLVPSISLLLDTALLCSARILHEKNRLKNDLLVVDKEVFSI